MKRPGNDVLILSLCSILKDFMSMKNFVRLTAFKAATSAYCANISEFVDDMVLKASKDKSVLLRKAASTSMLKVACSDQISKSPSFTADKKQVFLRALERAMTDSLASSGTAVMVYYKVGQADAADGRPQPVVPARPLPHGLPAAALLRRKRESRAASRPAPLRRQVPALLRRQQTRPTPAHRDLRRPTLLQQPFALPRVSEVLPAVG